MEAYHAFISADWDRAGFSHTAAVFNRMEDELNGKIVWVYWRHLRFKIPLRSYSGCRFPRATVMSACFTLTISNSSKIALQHKPLWLSFNPQHYCIGIGERHFLSDVISWCTLSFRLITKADEKPDNAKDTWWSERLAYTTPIFNWCAGGTTGLPCLDVASVTPKTFLV